MAYVFRGSVLCLISFLLPSPPGLNDLIPDQLLSMFDENELELLMCGTCAFSVTDMQRYYIPSGEGEQFAQVR